MRWLFVVFCLSFAALSQASAADPLNGKIIEKILVLKSAHQLQLISDGKPLKTYRISLGRNPKGQKLIAGDRRTPEGFYWVDWRKTSDNTICRCTCPTPISATRPAPAVKTWTPAA